MSNLKKIKNFEDLARTPLRKLAFQMIEAGIAAIDTKTSVRSAVRFEGDVLMVNDKKIRIHEGGRLFVVGVGKCSLEAAAALEEILGDRITAGIVVDVHDGELKKIKAYAGDHPFPSQRNVDVTKAMIDLLRDAREDDVVIAIVSGGGSTLLCQPQNMTCQDEAFIVEHLFREGATIQKINTLRKHLSLARGGYLAKYAYPATVVSLIFSDVPGNDIRAVASGPTVRDLTTIADAKKIAEEFGVRQVSHLSGFDLIETPKEEKYFSKVHNFLIVSNIVALQAMAAIAEQNGFNPVICGSCIFGEARVIGEGIVKQLGTFSGKTALLYGGETTVTMKGNGKGGRNQELALSALRFIKNNQLVVSFASDGKDNSEFAGALCDIITKENAALRGFDPEEYLARNDAYPFFREVGDYFLTGDTGSNVSDLIIALKE
ncbi:MAG: DUF4147 domain-containing protein [Patescibacteria group bacterium]